MSEVASSRGPDDGPDVQASLSGDSDAYARLIARHQQAIGSYMWRFTRDRVQWEELVHDVFVEAYLSLRGYRGEAPLLHWLRKIATRVGYRWWKRRTRRKAETSLELQDWDQVAGADSGIDAAREAGQQVHALLARMSARDRLVLTLLYLEECSVAEAARLCGWSQTMVKVQAFRARKKLKKLLEQGEHPL
jgi:RNA polymerase sigma-70 factor (ECF subfamily)